MKLQFINKIILSALLISALTITSCKKEDKKTDNPATEVTKGSLKIEFEHAWGTSDDFVLNDTLLHPKTNEKLYFTKFKYYVSNIKLKKTDGTWWSETESYYLVDVSDASSCILKLSNIPAGTYTEMQYTMGVDSIRNVSGAQTGALSATNDMFWSWNSGYIMLKAEGKSPNSSTKDFALHLGGFKGTNNVVTIKNTNFNGSLLNISQSATPQIHMSTDPSSLWNTNPGVVYKNNITMPGTDAKQAAKDFYSDIEFEHLHP